MLQTKTGQAIVFAALGFAFPFLVGAQENIAVFDEVVDLVQKNFYDSSKLGSAWQKKVRAHRDKAATIGSHHELETMFKNLLSELDASHTNYFSRFNPKRYQLLGVFHGLYDANRKELFVYNGIGITTKYLDGQYIIESVFDGFPAKKAGLRFGDVLESVNGRAFAPIRSFENLKDTTARIQFRRAKKTHEVDCLVQEIDGRTMFEHALKSSSQTFSIGNKKIAYLHAWSYAGTKYQEIIREQILWGKLSDCDGLILDLRDGWGGADINYLNLFRSPIAKIESTDRNNKSFNFTGTWNKPVVLLTNERSTSGKELFSYGFKKLNLGTIVGQKTAGAVLAGRCFLLSNGDVLYLAVSEVRVDGKKLEGDGVKPDVSVDRKLREATFPDPQLEIAKQELLKRLPTSSQQQQ